MGSGCSKTGLLQVHSSKSDSFSWMKNVVNCKKSTDLDEHLNKQQKQRRLWSQRSCEGTKAAFTVEKGAGNAQMNNPEVKFRTKFDPRVTARYDIKALIGRGSYSCVVRAEHRHTRQPYAIKLSEVRGREGREACCAEVGVLRRVRHTNIIRLLEVLETSRRVYLVLELATGGELLERVVAQGSFTERDASKALTMVSSGLCYIHALGVIHRDLKPENLLYYHPGQDSRLIITDFGLACWGSRHQLWGGSGTAVGFRHGAGSYTDFKGKGMIEDGGRLVDDGKARESIHGRVVAIGRDERGDMSECLITAGDERGLDERLGFNGCSVGSSSVEDDSTRRQALSEGTETTKEGKYGSQTSGPEPYKHNSLDAVEERVDADSQEKQARFSHGNTKGSRRATCAASGQGGDEHSHSTSVCGKTSGSPTTRSGGGRTRDWAVSTLCGTPEFLAPEMVGGRPYSCAVDLWALGVISYILLSGSMPFEQRRQSELFRAILRGSYSFHGEPWDSVSNQAKDFIECLLSLNPEVRMTAEQALCHPWLATMAACSPNKNLHRPISQNLRRRASRTSSRSSSAVSSPGSRPATCPRSHPGPESRPLAGSISQHSAVVCG